MDVRHAMTRLRVLPIFADFTQSLSLTEDGTRLVALMGGTLGNFYPDERRLFLEHLASTLAPGDHVLLGTDLLKSADGLVASHHGAVIAASFGEGEEIRIILSTQFRIPDLITS